MTFSSLFWRQTRKYIATGFCQSSLETIKRCQPLADVNTEGQQQLQCLAKDWLFIHKMVHASNLLFKYMKYIFEILLELNSISSNFQEKAVLCDYRHYKIF